MSSLRSRLSQTVLRWITYDDFGDLVLLLMSHANAPSWLRTRDMRRRIGLLDHFVRGGRARKVQSALREAYGGEKDEREIQALSRGCFASRWEHKELFWLRRFASSAGDPEWTRRVACEGANHLHDALKRGKGVIIWESPFGNRALGRLTLAAQGFPVSPLQGPGHGGGPSRLGQSFIKPLHRAAQRSLSFDAIHIQTDSAAYILELQRRLRNNGVVCISSFGPMARRFAVLPFLGAGQCIATGVPSLAQATGAALIPVFCFRLPDGSYRWVLEPPVPSSTEMEAARMQMHALRYYVGLVERYVNQYPDQWLRWHDRLTPSRAEFRNATLIKD